MRFSFGPAAMAWGLSALLLAAPGNRAWAAENAIALEQAPSFILQQMLRSQWREQFVGQMLAAFQRAARGNRLGKEEVARERRQVEARRRAAALAKLVQSILALDLNGDGLIDAAERAGEGRDRFDRQGRAAAGKADRDGDGTVTMAEIVALLQAPDAVKVKSAGRRGSQLTALLQLDSDGDGVLHLEELRRVAGALFDQVDDDADGKISDPERNRLIGALQQSKRRETRPRLEPVGLADDEELHVVGVYEGRREKDGDSWRGAVPVRIERPGKRVALLLVAYEPVVWQLAVGKDTNLSRVLLAGRNRERSIVEVDGRAFGGSTAFATRSRAHRPYGSGFRALLADIARATGRERIDGFAGNYRPGLSGFLIDRVQQDAELKLRRLTPRIDALPPNIRVPARLRGQTGLFDPAGRRTGSIAALGLKPLSVWVPAHDRFYAGGSRGLQIHDAAGALIEKVPASSDLPRLSFPSGLAYDPQGDRLVLSTIGGAGHLYAYKPGDGAWSLLGSLQGLDIEQLTHDEATGGFVALAKGPRRNGLVVHQFDADGRRTGGWPIAFERFPGLYDLFDPGNGPGPDLRLFSRGNHLVLLAASFRDRRQGTTRIYLYDRARDEVTLTWADEGAALR